MLYAYSYSGSTATSSVMQCSSDCEQASDSDLWGSEELDLCQTKLERSFICHAHQHIQPVQTQAPDWLWASTQGYADMRQTKLHSKLIFKEAQFLSCLAE